MLSAFEKLRKRDKVVLVLFAFILLVGAATMLVDLLRGNTSRNVQFPESILADSSEQQVYQVNYYQELPIQIKFPHLPYGVSIAGVETVVSDDGCTFLYGNGRYLCALETVKDAPMSEILSEQLSEYIFGKTGAKYRSEISTSGYLNTLYCDYECGVVSIDNMAYYIMAYRYHTTEQVDVVLAVADMYTDSMDKNKEMLDRMFYTLCLMEQPETASVSSEPQQEEQSMEQEDDEKSSNKTSKERMKEVLAEIDAQMMDGKYAKWYEDEVVLEEPMQDVYFIFHMGVEKLPSEAYLVAPDGTVYQDYMAGEYEPSVIFPIQDAQEGKWRLLVTVDNRDMGVVYFDALKREAYEKIHDYDSIAETSMPHPVE